MIFTIQAQEMFLEIDLTSLVSNINSIETQVSSGKNIKSEGSIKNIIDGYNKIITSSSVKIKKRKFSSSINYTTITNAKLLEGKNGIYLVFSVIEGNKKYNYNFKLMNKVAYKITTKVLFFNSYKIFIDEETLRAEIMEKTLNNGIRKHYSVKNIGFFFNFKLFIFSLIILIFGLGIANAFGYFGV